MTVSRRLLLFLNTVCTFPSLETNNWVGETLPVLVDQLIIPIAIYPLGIEIFIFASSQLLASILNEVDWPDTILNKLPKLEFKLLFNLLFLIKLFFKGQFQLTRNGYFWIIIVR